MVKQKLTGEAGSLAGVFEEQSKPVGAVGDKVKEVIAGGGGRVQTQQ